MIGAFLLLCNISFFGLLTSYFFGLKLFLEERIAAAILVGLIALGYISFTIGYFVGLDQVNLVVFLIILNLLILLQLRQRFVNQIKDELTDFLDRYKKRSWQILGVFTFIFILVFGYLGSQLLTSRGGVYYVQPVHAYGDISLHLGIINSFVFGNNFPPQNPNFSGTPMSYPFMVDYITAFFTGAVGLPVEIAVGLTGAVLFGLLIILFVFFVFRLTKNKAAAIVALTIFLFSGGFGFIYFYGDWANSGKDLVGFLLSNTKDYTAMKDIGYWWINVNLSMLLPQRSFLFGFPTSILILTTLLQLKEKFSLRTFLFVTLLTSLLPLLHTHSLLALVPFALYFGYFILKKEKEERLLIILIGLNGLAIAYLLSRIFLAQATNIFSLIHLQIGWMSNQESVLRFYIKNFGLILLVLPFAYYFLRKQKQLFYLGLLSLVWFILPSMLVFQPWDFDNIKLFVYWYFFAAIVAGAFLVSFFKQGAWQKAVVVLAVGVIILSGFLDVGRVVVSAGTRYSVYEQPEIKLAEFIKNNTPPNAVFVSEDKFNNPAVSLAGRKAFMGFSAWLWTYGLDFAPRQAMLKSMLAGSADASIFKKYHITHVLFFPNETNYTQNQEYFDKNAKLIYSEDGYRLYQL